MPTDPKRVRSDDAGRLALAADLSRYGLLVMSLYFVATFFIAAVVRLTHPFELEWLEGAVVDHVARVVDGQPVYVAPSLDFVPFMYTPIYYWVSAAFSTVIGVGFAPLRLTSLLASLGTLLVLFLFTLRETDDRSAALASAGFYAATYPLVGEWFDMGRSDALGLFFVLAGAYWLRGAATLRDHAIAGLLFVAAFFTKQVALFVVLPMALYCVAQGRGASRLVFPGVALGGLALGSALAHAVSDGWFGFYVFQLPIGHFLSGSDAQQAIVARGLLGFWTQDLARALPVPFALALAAGAALAWDRRGRDVAFFSLLAAGLLAASWSQRLHLGGYWNVLMPAYALIALLAGRAVHDLPARLARPRGPDDGAAASRGRAGALAIHVLCIVQLGALYYDPGEVIPGEVDRDEGTRLVALMAQVEGDVLSPAHGHLPRMAGHAPSAHLVAIHDVVRAGGPVGAALRAGVVEALETKRAAAIFGPLLGFSGPLGDHYTVTRMGSPAKDVVFPRGAAVGRSRDVYLPRVD